jgi:ribonuclease R
MRSLLLRLSLGLHEQDILKDERPFVDEWLEKGIVVNEASKFRFHSKYRAGTISAVENETAYLQAIGLYTRDLLIEGENLNEAKEGDLVIAMRLMGRRGTPQAKVIVIVGRAVSYSVAYLANRDGHLALLDIRTEHPAGVPLSPEELSAYREGDCLQIDNQNNVITKLLGNLDDPKVDEKIVLAQYNKHDEFSDEVLKLAQSFESVDASHYPDRKDLRHLPFCTIDPVTAKDFDDAIYFDVKNSVLYVAIADVSAYVTPFGPIDAEAIYRGFSIYLPHRSIPMLPRQLSETLCSLQPHVDRLAYVFEMHLDPVTLENTHSEVYESIIHSQRRFTYEEIDALFENSLHVKPEEKAVIDYIFPLRDITDRLKEIRLKTGYDFRSKELEMSVNDNQELVSTTYAEETPSHALIEDCMLLANKAAASMYNRGVFRIHEPPSQAKLQNLYQELAGVGIMVEPKASIKETITSIQEQARERELESEVDTLIIRAQMRARYAPENSGHFGLGFERYTHFTSPIRRYSDLIVHRLIKAIQAQDTEEGSYVLRNIDALTIAISEKERESADIEIRYMQRKFARWASLHVNETFTARIATTETSLQAQIDDEIKGATVEITNAIPIMLFDDVRVKIERVNLATARIYGSVIEKVSNETP